MLQPARGRVSSLALMTSGPAFLNASGGKGQGGRDQVSLTYTLRTVKPMTLHRDQLYCPDEVQGPLSHAHDPGQLSRLEVARGWEMGLGSGEGITSAPMPLHGR